MRRRFVVAPLLAVALVAGLAGCDAANPYEHLKDLAGGGNDEDNQATMAALSYDWRVTNYTGSVVPPTTVPTQANMRWDLNTDGTFTVTSSGPVMIAVDEARTYNEAGRWRVINGAAGIMGLTVTSRDGVAVPTNEQVEVTGTWSLTSQRDMALLTTAVGPGSVRYVLTR